MGVGGLGGYFGGRLANAGADVAFLARGRNLAALRNEGLRIRSQLGDLHLAKVVATDDPAALGPVDLVIIAVKLWDTQEAAREIAPLVERGASLVARVLESVVFF
jgi:2-dehydropantoate 2-reductase